MKEIRDRASILASSLGLPAFLVEGDRVEPISTGGIASELFATIHLLYSSMNHTDTELRPPYYTHVIRMEDGVGLTTLNIMEVTATTIRGVIFGPLFVGQEDRTRLMEYLEGIYGETVASRLAATIPQRTVESIHNAGILALNFLEGEKFYRGKTHILKEDGNYFFYSETPILREERMMESRSLASYTMAKDMTKLIRSGDSPRLKILLRQELGLSDRRGTRDRRQETLERLNSFDTLSHMVLEGLGVPRLYIQSISERFRTSLEKAYDNTSLLSAMDAMVESYASALKSVATANNSAPVIRVKRYIAENLDGELGLEELSTVAALSPSYLSRLFRKENHMTIREFITNMRVNEAKGLLVTTELPVGSIGESVGYPDQSYFAQLFLKSTGQSPSEYRRQKKESSF